MSAAPSTPSSTAPPAPPTLPWVPGELALGCKVEISDHDQVPDGSTGVVVGHNTEAGTLLVDVTGDDTRNFKRQRTVAVRDD